MLPRLAFVLLTILPAYLYAQNPSFTLVDTKGHFIGESVADLLSKEPEIQQKLNGCQQQTHEPTCSHLLAAVTRGQRARLSNSNWTSFVVDGGKLVKLQTLLHGSPDAAKDDVSKRYGPQTSETAFPMQNAMGAKWEDHLSVWETAAVYVGLREDNNPASQNHHLVLVVESQQEHAREREQLHPPTAEKY